MKDNETYKESLNCVDNDFYRHNQEVLDKKFGVGLVGPKYDLHWNDE